MEYDIPYQFICHLAHYLPDRRASKRGPKPIPKIILLKELFKLFKYNCGWRNIKHSSTCRNYLYELQRRGLFINFFNFLVEEETKFRLAKTTIDSTDIVSYKTNGLVKYSGKYHNYCIKLSVEFTPEYLPVSLSVDQGSNSDSKILDRIIVNKDKLPYELCLDKGYENYERRRALKKRNCQIRMEMRNYDKNRKRGPRFRFTEEDKLLRGDIEKCFGWIKSFMILRCNRLRKKSLIMAIIIFCVSYYTFLRLSKF